MSCGAFGGSGSCGGGGDGGCGAGAGAGGAGAGFGQGPRHYADRRFFDPFCIPVDKRCEPKCYFNPFVHAQCLGVDMNMQGFRNDILKCQDDYKKAVWAVLKKYAVGEGKDMGKENNNNTSNNSYGVPAFMNLNMNNRNTSMGMRNSRMLTGPTPNAARRSISSGFQYDDDPRMLRRASRHNMPAPGDSGRGVGGSGFGSDLSGEFGLGAGSLFDDPGLGDLLNGNFGLAGVFGSGSGGGPMQA